MKVTKINRLQKDIIFEGKSRVLVVEYGIRYITGNSKSYFTITGTVYKTKTLKTFIAGGCIHDIIAKYCPELKPFIALHVSFDDGIPMHCIENGFYYCKNPNEYPVKVLADHLRIDLDTARNIYSDVENGTMDKEGFSSFALSQYPRFKMEADNLLKILGIEPEEKTGGNMTTEELYKELGGLK